MNKKKFLAHALERTGLGSLLSLSIGRWDGLLVFNYHRVGDWETSSFDRALWSATQDEFDRQVRFLKQNFDIISVGELGDVLAHPQRQAVMLTFDDGYRDNYELAYPVLRQHRAAATFFIASGFLDDRPVAWWDEIAWMVRCSACRELPASEWSAAPLPLLNAEDKEAAIHRLLLAYKQLPEGRTDEFFDRLSRALKTGRCPRVDADDLWMTWDMVREMDRGGQDIGGHTVTHPVLANAPLETQRREIFHSKERIERELDHPITAFSYPVGQPDSFTDETKELLREAGYEWAFSFFGGFSSTSHSDRYALPRVAVSPQLTAELFQSTARLPWLFA